MKQKNENEKKNLKGTQKQKAMEGVTKRTGKKKLIRKKYK